jgi:glucosylceramidase
MKHFSKYIRPGAKRIGFEVTDESMKVTAFQNPDNSIVVVVFNEFEKSKTYTIQLNQQQITIPLSAQAIQTVVISL